MAKMEKSQSKKNELVSAALELFLENGYEGTSIRMITNKIGCPVGLFYYYFETKDDVFKEAIDAFFGKYKKALDDFITNNERDTFRLMLGFNDLIIKYSNEVRQQLSRKVHWTVSWAIRERALSLLVPYYKRIAEKIVKAGAPIKLDLDMAAIVITHGVCNTIFHEDSNWIEKNHSQIRRFVNLIFGVDPDNGDIIFPYFALEKDKQDIMNLGYQVINQNALLDRIKRKEIFVIRRNDVVVGYIAFSKKEKLIDSIMVDDKWTHKGIGMRLLTSALAQFKVGAEIMAKVSPKRDEFIHFYERYGFHQTGEDASTVYFSRKVE